MNREAGVLRTAEFLLHLACIVFPQQTRTEHFAEWQAELPSILDDSSKASRLRREACVIAFAADQVRSSYSLTVPLRRYLINAAAVVLICSIMGVPIVERAIQPTPHNTGATKTPPLDHNLTSVSVNLTTTFNNVASDLK
jgi:hypothetical protein